VSHESLISRVIDGVKQELIDEVKTKLHSIEFG
jgi:hypothetical protein